MAREREARLKISADDHASRTINRISSRLRGLAQTQGFSRLQGQMKNVQASMGSVQKSLGPAISGFKALAGSLGIASLSAGGLFAAAHSFASATDEMQKFARVQGMTLQGMREMQFAADRQGASFEKVQAGIRTLNKRLGDLRSGTGPLKALPEQLKQDLLAAESSQEALQISMRAIADASSEADRASLAARLFSKGNGAQFLRLVANGYDNIEGLSEEFRILGGVLGKDAGPQAEDFMDKMANFQTIIKGVRDAIGERLVPVFTPLIQGLNDWMVAHRGLVAMKIEEWVTTIRDAVRDMDWRSIANDARDFGRSVRGAVEAVGGVRNALLIAGGIAFAPTIAAVATLTASLTRLAWVAGSAALPALRGIAAMNFASAVAPLTALMGGGKGNASRLSRVAASGRSLSKLNLGPVSRALLAISALSFGAVAASLAVLGGAGWWVSRNLGKVEGEVGALKDSLSGLRENVRGAVSALRDGDWSGAAAEAKDALGGIRDAHTAIFDVIAGLRREALIQIGDLIGFDGAAVDARIASINAALSGAFSDTVSKIQASADLVRKAFSAIRTFIQDFTWPKIGAPDFSGVLGAIERLKTNLQSLAGKASGVMQSVRDALDARARVNAAAGESVNDQGFIQNSDGTVIRGRNGRPIEGRAFGGPVRRGVPYMVGERGPEVVVPSQSGGVLNNSILRGMAGGGRAGRSGPADTLAGRADLYVHMDDRRTTTRVQSSGNLFRRIEVDPGRAMQSA